MSNFSYKVCWMFSGPPVPHIPTFVSKKAFSFAEMHVAATLMLVGATYSALVTPQFWSPRGRTLYAVEYRFMLTAVPA